MVAYSIVRGRQVGENQGATGGAVFPVRYARLRQEPLPDRLSEVPKSDDQAGDRGEGELPLLGG